MFKAAIKQEQSQACLNSAEREQTRHEVSMFNEPTGPSIFEKSAPPICFSWRNK